MPVRSLNLSVFKWPDAKTVDAAARRWAKAAAKGRDDVVKIGYFGSYARGDWGVGSDLDLIIILESSTQPFERRSVEWKTTGLPVQADVLVYTKAEWETLHATRFHQTVMREAVWIY
jgi:predicted nucleotidyltransferase